MKISPATVKLVEDQMLCQKLTYVLSVVLLLVSVARAQVVSHEIWYDLDYNPDYHHIFLWNQDPGSRPDPRSKIGAPIPCLTAAHNSPGGPR